MPSPLCPNKNLKTVFFENSGRNKNESIDIEKIGIIDPKFYVCYSKSIPTESISDIMSKNNLIQSYQIWGDHNLHFSNKGIRLQKIPNNIKFNEYQKINFYPESNINKDELYIYYLNFNKKFPSEYNYMPEAFINPKDSKKIKEIFEDYNFGIKNLWIFQRAVNEDGGGVKFFRGYYQIGNARTINSSFLIKKYINNPFLINNKKFNIKAYALVTGLNPLRIYLYNDGLLLFNNYEFNLNKDQLKNNSVHFLDDNWSSDDGRIWNFSEFMNFCEKNEINYNKIKNKIIDIIIKSFISFYEYINEKVIEYNYSEKNFFEIFSFDFLLDSEEKLYLLKMTGDAKIETNTRKEIDLYNNLIIDTLNIIGLVPFSHDEKHELLVKNDDKIKNINTIEEKINDALCEISRPMGQFERIFPIKDNINKYEKFFEKENISKENKLFWTIIRDDKSKF